MRRLLLVVIGFALLTAAGAAQSASITSTAPASISTVTGQQRPIDVNYRTGSLGSGWSCSLGYVSSSLPTGWTADTAVSAAITGGSTETVTSPTVEFLTPADTSISLLLECSDGTQTVTDTASVPAVVTDPPTLSGSLVSPDSVTADPGEELTVTFSTANTGSAATENARAIIDASTDLDAPDSIALTEAGQSEGVIRAGRSSGRSSFTVDVDEDADEDGTVTIDLTASRIGTTDTMTVSIDVNTTDSGDSPDGGGSGGGGLGTGDLPDDAVSHLFTDLEPGTRQRMEPDTPGLRSIGIDPAMAVATLTLNVAPATIDALPSHAGPVYTGYNISTTANSSVLSGGAIGFTVNRSWVDDHGGPSAVRLERYSDDWQVLETSRNGSTSDSYRFTASTPGFSYFAVAAAPQDSGGDESGQDDDEAAGGDDPGTDQDPTGGTNATDPDGNSTNSTATSPGSGGPSWLLIGGGLILVLALAGGTLFVVLETDLLEQLRSDQPATDGRRQELEDHLEILSREIAEAMEQGRLDQDPQLFDDLEEIESMIEAGQYSEAERQMRQAEQLLGDL